MKKRDEELGDVLRGAFVPPPRDDFMETLLGQLDERRAGPGRRARRGGRHGAGRQPRGQLSATPALVAAGRHRGRCGSRRRRHARAPARARVALAGLELPASLTLSQVLQRLSSPASSVSAIVGRWSAATAGGKMMRGKFLVTRGWSGQDGRRSPQPS